MISQRLTSLMILAMLISMAVALADDGRREEGRLTQSPHSPKDAADYATTVLDINKLGQMTTNRGHLYDLNYDDHWGEWPYGSGHCQLYRCNVFVGVPENVVQSLTATSSEDRATEWNPLPGYHNAEYGVLAVTTDSLTWPQTDIGESYWPHRDDAGNPVIVSHQDSYGAYDDGDNVLALEDSSMFLNIEIHQHSYAWDTALDEDYIFFQFDVINNGDPKDSLYFTHFTDVDAGDWRAWTEDYGEEYTDDTVMFDRDRQFYSVWDADNFSLWEHGDPFYMGVVFLETPEIDGQELGITDWHFTAFDGDTSDIPNGTIDDKELFWYMSSDPRLRDDSEWPDLFHGDDLHFDDCSLISEEGRLICVLASSGPYHMEQGDTLQFTVALVCGADYDDISKNADRIIEVFENDYVVKSVPQPIRTGIAGDNQVTLQWDTRIDTSYVDAITGTNNLQGYRIYKTEDPRQLTWTLMDSLAVGELSGGSIEYQWIDTDVINGFYYSYAVTAFDSTDYESGIAGVDDQANAVELRPTSDPGADLEEIRVVPNPCIISARWERDRLGNPPVGEPIRELAFVNLPGECTIKIFTLDGDLIRTIHHTNGTGTEYWDIRSDYNRMVKTGVYFYHVVSDHKEHLGKFAIIR